MSERNEITEISTFKNGTFGNLNIININGEPWFIAKEVADALGYANSRKAVHDHVSPKDRVVTNRYTLGGNQNMTIISESGLYAMILSSKLPRAIEFRDWVTSEVIPSIRRHEVYVSDNTTERLDRLEKRFQMITDWMMDVIKRRQTYEEYVKSAPANQPITVIARDYEWSARRMNAFLRDRGIQFKDERRNVWLLTPEYASKGYAVTETYKCASYTATHTNWTPAGRMFIYSLMKEAGYRPLMEQYNGTTLTAG